MSNATTTATPTAKRKLPAPLTNEQVAALKPNDLVVARESGKLYEITAVEGGLKGRAVVGGKQTGPTRPLSAAGISAFAEKAPAVVPVPDPATVAPNGPAAKLAAQAGTKVTTIDAGGGIGVDVIEQQPKTPAVAPASKKPQPQPEVKPKQQTKQVYKLEVNGRTTRYERVIADLIKVRNRERERGNNQGRWIEVAEADVPRGFTILEPMQYTPAERAALTALGRQKDEEIMSKREQQKAEKAEKTEKTTKKSDSGEATEKPAKKAAKAKVERPEYHGVGMCEFLRYAGSKGWDKKVVKIVAEKVGFAPSPTTIHIQTKKGADGENVPTLSKDARNELKGFVEEAKATVAEEKAAKAEKKSSKKSDGKKGSKSGGKKKAAKAEAEEDESADDEAEEDTASEDAEEAADDEDESEETADDTEDDSDEE
jgi:hypothetical protein